jgi:sugar phosphate isomerase/epimerase
VVSLQALLFGRPDLAIFGAQADREKTFAYLAAIIRLGSRLGAGALVFGSPRNRRIGGLSASEADELAVPFFRELGRIAASERTLLVLEPNPSDYGCDYIRTASEALELVRAVDSPGFRLHLDSGAMTLSKEPVEDAVRTAAPYLAHFQASEAELAPVGSGSVDHRRFARALREIRYAGWVSVEMRAAADDAVGAVRKALEYAVEAYAGDS